MNDFERRIRELINPWSTKFSDWWSQLEHPVGPDEPVGRHR